jgi:hypothetical protein
MNLVAVFLAAHIGAISGSIGGNAFLKNWAESTIKWAALGFWGTVWGARLGKRRPHTEFSAPLPPETASKSLASVAVWGASGDTVSVPLVLYILFSQMLSMYLFYISMLNL